MQTIPYPVYYVLVVNDGEILAGHYCSYFIARHLDGDAATEGFYKLIEPHIVYSQVEPKEENVAQPAIGG